MLIRLLICSSPGKISTSTAIQNLPSTFETCCGFSSKKRENLICRYCCGALHIAKVTDSTYLRTQLIEADCALVVQTLLTLRFRENDLPRLINPICLVNVRKTSHSNP
jgi:hypothetical protein